jgi:hypothetical protein
MRILHLPGKLHPLQRRSLLQRRMPVAQFLGIVETQSHSHGEWALIPIMRWGTGLAAGSREL